MVTPHFPAVTQGYACMVDFDVPVLSHPERRLVAAGEKIQYNRPRPGHSVALLAVYAC